MDTVTIENKKYPFLFGMAVLKRFADYKQIKSVNKSLEVITSMNFNDPSPQNMDDLATLFLYSLQRGSAKEGKEIKLNLDDIIDWIYSGSSDLQKMINHFTDSLGVGESKPAKSGKVAA